MSEKTLAMAPAHPGYSVPTEIWVADGYLEYKRAVHVDASLFIQTASGWHPIDVGYDGPGLVPAKSTATVLDRFQRLDDSLDDERFAEQALAFARDWGPLELCEHGVIHVHSAPVATCDLIQRHPVESPPVWREPLGAWRRHVRHVRALQKIAAHLGRGERGDPADWAVVDEFTVALASPFRRIGPRGFGEIRLEGLELASALREWVRLGQLSLHTEWSPERQRLQVESRGVNLPGALAHQLVLTLTSPLGIYECAGCGQPFAPAEGKRRPPRGKKAWCPECGRLAQWRAYQKQNYKPKQRIIAGDGEAEVLEQQ